MDPVNWNGPSPITVHELSLLITIILNGLNRSDGLMNLNIPGIYPTGLRISFQDENNSE